MVRKVEISHRTVIFTVIFFLSLWLLYTIRDVILALFVALLIMAVLDPLVRRLTQLKVKIPRGLAVLLVYIVVFGILGTAVGMLITPLVSETTGFVTKLPEYLRNITLFKVVGDQGINNLLGQLVQVPGQILSVGVSFFSNFVLTIGSLVFAFYLLLAREKLDTQLSSFFGEARSRNIMRVVDTLEVRLGSWARGQLLLMLTIGLATFVGLIILGIPYALPLGILAGILEIVPTLGPIVAAIPSIIIGFGISPAIGIAAAALSLLIHQLENYLLVPKIMEKSIGISPIITLLALAVGAKLAGIVGVLISVPVLITIQILAKNYLGPQKK